MNPFEQNDVRWCHDVYCTISNDFRSLYYNPRLSLTDYPQDIQKVVFPKSIHEKSKRFILILHITLFFSVLLSFLHIYYINMKNYYILMPTYILFGILMIFNLVDLLIIDWLIFCWITPKFIVIPSTGRDEGI